MDAFRAQAIKALEKLENGSQTKIERFLFAHMRANIERTPIFFYPGGTLRYAVQRIGSRVGISVVQGENVTMLRIIQIGGRRIIERKNFINLPAEHIFAGEKLSMDGILTLCHEYAHFPKPKIRAFAQRLGLLPEQAEELLADMLAAKLAIALGFGKQAVLKHFAGREIVYGKFPYFTYIGRAIE